MSKAGITNASVHTLRHTFATRMVSKGTNLRVIQDALGRTSLQTTPVYVSLVRELRIADFRRTLCESKCVQHSLEDAFDGILSCRSIPAHTGRASRTGSCSSP